MPDIQLSLDDPRTSGRSLFALKRIADALEAGFLTLEESRRAAKRISSRYARIFDCVATLTTYVTKSNKLALELANHVFH
jgi:hypothetical protein